MPLVVASAAAAWKGGGKEERDVTDEELAAELAREAGELLMELRRSGGLDPFALGAAGDKAANALILEGLRRWRPDDAVLTEESPDDKVRLDRSRVWIIDPLDGTREFSEGRDDWAVHVGLAVDGAPALGAVALPALGRLYRTDAPPVLPPAGEPLRMVVSRTRPPGEAAAIAESLGARILKLGSAGAKAMAVVAGEADLYFHSGGQHEWDNCAPAAVARAVGLVAARADGSPLIYNRNDKWVPDLVIARGEVAEQLFALWRRIKGAAN